MPDTRERYPEEDGSMLSPMKMREVARQIEQSRKILLAKVVVSMRYDPGNQAGEANLNYLQGQFESEIRSMPIWLRSERFLSKHVVQVAERRLAREGVLSIGRQMKEWTL